MDRAVVIWLVPILLGGLLVVSAPPDPQYSVSVYGPTDPPTNEAVVAFDNLSAENQSLFQQSFDDGTDFASPPPIQRVFVEYQGDVYDMSATVSEGSLWSILFPRLGALLVAVGCVGSLGTAWRRRR